MTALSSPLLNTPPTTGLGAERVQTCDTRDGLSAFHDPATELVIWERALPKTFRTWVDGLEASALPHLRLLIEPKDLPWALEQLLNEAALPIGDMRDFMVMDIYRLAKTFAAITRETYVDIRLEHIDNDACWKFHRDAVDTRLIATYRGPTTEWVPLGLGEQAVEQQKAYAGPLERLGQDDVALFKGSGAVREEGQPVTGVVHRSPPIQGTGISRLLLCLNQPSVVSPERWAPA